MLALRTSYAQSIAQRFFNRDVPRFTYDGERLSEAAYRKLTTDGFDAVALDVDGARLRGISRSPLKKDAPWVVFFAGNGPALLAEARAFTLAIAPTRAFGVVTFAYRGFDGSTGSSSRATLLADAMAAYDHVRTRNRHVHIVGFSLGAMSAAHLAATRAPLTVSLLAPFTTIAIGPRSPFGRLLPGDRYSLLPSLTYPLAPVSVAHGDVDTVLPMSMGHEVAARVGTQLFEVEGTGHNDLLRDHRLIKWLRARVEK
jgi:hypothetical protein